MSRPIVQLLATASFSALLVGAPLAGEAKPDAGAPDAPAAGAGDGTPAAAKPAAGGDGGEPTYEVAADGKVSWAIYEGYKRYHAECHTCHGPNGLGSTFAPALAETMKGGNYAQFKEVVANGKASGDKAMPGFANNPNVMCYVDSIYVYLKARADGKVKAGDEAVKNHEAKTSEAQAAEKDCMK
jgi:methanol metabolism-related c-type cytochrome